MNRRGLNRLIWLVGLLAITLTALVASLPGVEW